MHTCRMLLFKIHHCSFQKDAHARVPCPSCSENIHLGDKHLATLAELDLVGHLISQTKDRNSVLMCGKHTSKSISVLLPHETAGGVLGPCLVTQRSGSEPKSAEMYEGHPYDSASEESLRIGSLARTYREVREQQLPRCDTATTKETFQIRNTPCDQKKHAPDASPTLSNGAAAASGWNPENCAWSVEEVTVHTAGYDVPVTPLQETRSPRQITSALSMAPEIPLGGTMRLRELNSPNG